MYQISATLKIVLEFIHSSSILCPRQSSNRVQYIPIINNLYSESAAEQILAGFGQLWFTAWEGLYCIW